MEEKVLKDIEIQEKLGQGTFGEVFRACWKGMLDFFFFGQLLFRI